MPLALDSPLIDWPQRLKVSTRLWTLNLGLIHGTGILAMARLGHLHLSGSHQPSTGALLETSSLGKEICKSSRGSREPHFYRRRSLVKTTTTTSAVVGRCNVPMRLAVVIHLQFRFSG